MTCPDCRRDSIDRAHTYLCRECGASYIDLRGAQVVDAATEQLRALVVDLRAEVARLTRERDEVRAHRAELDCRYTPGSVADFSGRHCEEPCDRCRHERLREAARALVESWETDSHGFRQSGYEDCAQALRAVLGEEP